MIKTTGNKKISIWDFSGLMTSGKKGADESAPPSLN